MDIELGYQILKRVTEDEVYFKRMCDDCEGLLKREGFTKQEDITELHGIISVLIKAKMALTKESEALRKWYSDQRTTTGQLSDKFKDGLKQTIEQIDKSFRATAIMYQVSFYLGILLITSAVVFAFLGKGSLLPIIFAGLGAADVVTFFIANPPKQLQKSRGDLAQLQMACFTWFNDYFNWNTMIGRLVNVHDPNKIYEYMKKFSDAQLESVSKTMGLIENYCEFDLTKETPPKRSKQFKLLKT